MFTDHYKAIWILDFEFNRTDGENPHPICLVAYDLVAQKLIRVWLSDSDTLPFDISENSLFVAYFASAEWNCFLALNWALPKQSIDLFVEFRNLTNNKIIPSGNSLLGALTYFGIRGITCDEKKNMRDLILSDQWLEKDIPDILDYCESDVLATSKLFQVMSPKLDFERALLRGRYIQAVARMETNGTPLDRTRVQQLKQHWTVIQNGLISSIDREFGVYDGSTFKMARWEEWLITNKIPWPRLSSGLLAMGENTFRDMSKSYPQISPIKELRSTLGKMRLSKLQIGEDGRNRCLLSPFASTTGRNQPSTTKFIFGPAAWMRSLIKPPDGYGMAYIDWSQQEFGIAAALSDDPLMKEAYASGDPYLTFAKQAGAVPKHATKTTHKTERNKFKTCVLAVQYGMGEASLAQKINQPPIYAKQLLNLHKSTYKIFWQWSDTVENQALLNRKLWTVFGWQCHYGIGAKKINPRSIRNFPMQANGAEMLRLACIIATEAGVEVCCPVHDAILIQAPLERLAADIAKTQQIMRQASQTILNGFALNTDVDVIHYPDRYQDERGVVMWDTIICLLEKEENTNSKPVT